MSVNRLYELVGTTGYESSAAGAVEVIASRSVEEIAVAAEERMMHYPHKLQVQLPSSCVSLIHQLQ